MKRKEIKMKDKNNFIKEKYKTNKERTVNLNNHKTKYYHPKAPVDQLLVVLLRENAQK